VPIEVDWAPTTMAAKRVPLRDPRSTEAKATLAELLAREGIHVSGGDAVEVGPEPAQADTPEPTNGPLAGCGRIVLRRERKGHGGKTVTVIDGLGLPDRVLQDLARQLRKALGCGSSVDAGRLLLQGDLAARAETWLQGQGARRITRGN